MLAAARVYAREGIAPGGRRANRRFFDAWTSWDSRVPEDTQLLLCDAQTSRGLLMSVEPAKLGALQDALHSAGTPAASAIGTLRKGRPGSIEVVAG